MTIRQYILPLSFALFLAEIVTASTVAILPLRAVPSATLECDILTEFLCDKLVRAGSYRLVDEAHMQELLQRQSDRLSGVFSVSDAVDVGQFLDAQLVLFGSCFKTEIGLEISTRLVDVSSAEILKTSAVSSELPVSVEQLAQRIVSELVSPTCTASSGIGTDHPPEHAVDENPASYWEAADGSSEGWLEISFPDRRRFSSAAFGCPDTRSGEGVPKSFQIEYRAGEGWEVAVRERGNMRVRWRGAFPPVSAARWRLRVFSLINPSHPIRISEFTLGE